MQTDDAEDYRNSKINDDRNQKLQQQHNLKQQEFIIKQQRQILKYAELLMKTNTLVQTKRVEVSKVSQQIDLHQGSENQAILDKLEQDINIGRRNHQLKQIENLGKNGHSTPKGHDQSSNGSNGSNAFLGLLN